MRAQGIPISARLRGLAQQRALWGAFELSGWIALLAAIEVLGRRLPASDIVALGLLVVLGLPGAWAAVALARRGWLPLTRTASVGLRNGARRWAQRFVPRYELALRLSPDVPTGRARPLVPSLLLLAAALTAAVVLGPRLTTLLAALRSEVSVLLHLALLSLLWTGLLALLTAAFVLQVQVLGVVLSSLVSALGLVAAALLPAYVFTAVVLGLGFAQSLRMAHRPLAPYQFCRRDARGGVRAVAAQTLLRRIHLLCTLGLALLVTLANAERLALGGLAHGQYAFTGCLGLLAALPSVLLMVRIDVHFGRLLCARSEPPETPLVPTLWWEAPFPPPREVAEVLEHGWDLLRGGTPREVDYDLVVGPKAAGPRRLALDPALSAEERAFARQRRFHVVHRRDFLRRLQALIKETRPAAGSRGTGFLLCPHMWLIPSLLRDTGRAASPVGPPFSTVFSPRSRRYVGMLLRALQVDVLYWEDTIGWADLKRVLGVAFECFDQGRLPIRERHFVGLPRVRVLLQDDEGPGIGPKPLPPGLPRAPVGTGARVLAILRDRGGEPRRLEAESPGDFRPAPLYL